jgi:hypothetical protein
MANNCDNVVRIYGTPENLKTLFDKLSVMEKQGLYLDNYQELFESVDDVEDWGSKWQMIDIDFTEGDDLMYVTGDSAWGPALGLWEKVSREFSVDIDLTYSEPGMNFAGRNTWSNGELTGCDEYTYYEYLYTEDNDYFWDEIGYLSECNTLEEIQDLLGDTWESLTEDEKSKVTQIQSDRYVE